MSQQFVKKTIGPELEKICSDEGFDINTPSGRGKSFQLWVKNLILKYDQSIDKEEIDDNFFLAKDGGVDMILYAHDSQRCYVVQTKYMSPNRSAIQADILGFFGIHKNIMEIENYIDNLNISNISFEALSEYKRKMKDGWNATWIFATTGKKPSGSEMQPDDNVDYLVYDSEKINEVFKEAHSQESTIPDKVDFSIPNDSYIELKEPRRTLIAVIKGNELQNIYNRHKERLLAINIRSFMGVSSRVNKDIQHTAKTSPENFLYFNNGISAICTKFKVNKSDHHVRVYAEKFQVINGGQTIGSLAKANPDDNIRVLLKLTTGNNVSTEKGFNEEIIRYNNTQNSIKISDFRANDKVQNDIVNKFRDLGLVRVLDKRIAYLPKRGKSAPPTHRKINLETLARIIYAYEENPCVSVERPKELWDIDKKYKDVFGEANDEWTTDKFHECVLSLAFYVAIEDKIKRLKKDAKENEEDDAERLKHLGRLKYHILGLAKVYIKHNRLSTTIWKNEKEFIEHFSEFWKTQSSVTNQIKSEADQKKFARSALSYIIRSNERWVSLKDAYKTLLMMVKDV